MFRSSMFLSGDTGHLTVCVRVMHTIRPTRRGVQRGGAKGGAGEVQRRGIARWALFWWARQGSNLDQPVMSRVVALLALATYGCAGNLLVLF